MLFTTEFNKVMHFIKRKLGVSQKIAYRLAVQALQMGYDVRLITSYLSNELFSEALSIIGEYASSLEVFPNGNRRNDPKLSFVLRVTVDCVGETYRERMFHPLGGRLVSAFPYSKRDNEGHTLHIKDESDSRWRRDAKVYALSFRR